MSNILAIVGRPNVGKSTFFNRLTGTRDAIVDATSGVTRDRHYGKSDWNGIEFSIIDTGGYITGSKDVFEQAIREQVEIAIDEADIILFLVDVNEGLTELDKDVAQILRKSEKKTFIAANKADTAERAHACYEFQQLGLGEVYPISSINGSGTGDLLDDIVKEFPETFEDEKPDLPKFAVVGRPNVGKSSLINALVGMERTMVTPLAGTTRDSIDIRYTSFGFDFLLIDTAGLRKKNKVEENIEFYSVLRSIRAIENSDVCLLMVDATLGFDKQDINIFNLAEKNHKGIVILVNKWDLIEKDSNTHKQFEQLIRKRIAPFTDVPVIFTSIPGKQRIFKALEVANEVYRNRTKKIPTSRLNEYLLPLVKETPPPSVKGKYIRIKYITQLKTHYPSFVFFCNLPQYVKEPYKRYVENKLREKFTFTGVPVQIYFRKK